MPISLTCNNIIKYFYREFNFESVTNKTLQCSFYAQICLITYEK